MTKLLTHHVGNLHLRSDAPFPRHCSDVKDMIRASRELQGITPHAKNLVGSSDAGLETVAAHPEGCSNYAGESSNCGIPQLF